jgi:hypothetical protein
MPWLVAGLVLVRVVGVGIALDGDATRTRRAVLTGDVRRYERIASHPGVAYRDFAVEYPPVTLFAIHALDGGTVHKSAIRVMWSQLLVDLAIAAVIAWGWGRKPALLYLLLGMAFIWYPFLYLRLDLLSVLLAVGGMALVRRRRSLTGAALVAVACFAKVWPIALAPGFAVRRLPRALAVFAVVGVAGVALWMTMGAVDGPLQVITFRGANGWQIESGIGSLVHTFGSARAHMESGAMRTGYVPQWARVALPLLGLALVVGVWAIAGRAQSFEARIVDGLAPLGAVVALLVTATILSPQYVSWLLPFAAIAAAEGERAVGWMTASIALLSTLGLNLVKELNAGDAIPVGIVLVRNFLLCALLALVVVRLVRLRAHGRAVLVLASGPEPDQGAIELPVASREAMAPNGVGAVGGRRASAPVQPRSLGSADA